MSLYATSYSGTLHPNPLNNRYDANEPIHGADARDISGQRSVGATSTDACSPVSGHAYEGGQHGMTAHSSVAALPAPNAAWPQTPFGSGNIDFSLPIDGYNTISTGSSSSWAGTGQSGSSYSMSAVTGQSSPTPMMPLDHVRDFRRQRSNAGCIADFWSSPSSNDVVMGSQSSGDSSSHWKHSVPVTSSSIEDSDNESLELDDKLRELVDRFVDHIMSTGEDPSESKKARAKVEQAAHLLNIDVFKVWHYLGQRSVHIGTVARVPAPGTPVMPSIVPFDAQPASIQEVILVIVNSYVSSHSTPCAAGPCDPPAKDAYQCIWPNCNYSHKKEAQWKRHVELRRPQSVYVCCLCFNSNIKPDSIFKDYRKDKLLTHLTAHGLAKGDRRREHVAQASCQAVPDTYRKACDRSACHYQSETWSQHISHAADHIKQAIVAARPLSVESASSSSRESLDDVGAALQGARKRSSAASIRVTGGSAQTSPRGRKKAKK